MKGFVRELILRPNPTVEGEGPRISSRARYQKRHRAARIAPRRAHRWELEYVEAHAGACAGGSSPSSESPAHERILCPDRLRIGM